MDMEPSKREYRQQKRELKREGSKLRRRQLKADLDRDPEDASHSQFHFGKFKTAHLNGIDHDATRKRPARPQSELEKFQDQPEIADGEKA